MPPENTDPLYLLLDGIADYAILLLDTAGCVTRWSTSAGKVFGYTAEEIQGQHVSRLYPAGATDSSRANEELEMASAHGRFEDIAWRARRDKSQLWADSVICPLRDERGRVQGFSVIIRDISERKKVEDALREKEEELTQARKMEAVGRLAGGVAHDFNNFITGIAGLADDIRQTMGDQDPRRADLDMIIKTADQARALTRELLAFGRKQVAAPQVININAVLQEKQKIFKRLLGANMQLEFKLDPTIRHILIDPTQLDQMLINLVMNARDAMEKGGIIRIETQRTASSSVPHVRLMISDTGCGMDASVLAHLFEPFFTTKEQGKGTGLGLATVYGIIKQNLGDISVQSRPGEGATFSILFPEIDAPITVQETVPQEAPAVVGSETILIVEDTDIVRRVVIQTLTKSGYRILSASSGAQALEIAREHTEPIHLLLSDLVMPGLNGRQLAEKLQAIHPETAVLYMSAYAKDLAEKRGALHDGEFFIEKPFTGAALSSKVRAVLNRHIFSTFTKVSS